MRKFYDEYWINFKHLTKRVRQNDASILFYIIIYIILYYYNVTFMYLGTYFFPKTKERYMYLGA